MENQRRKFLSLGAALAGAAAFPLSFAKAAGAACGVTPPQTSGPFYPGQDQFHIDNDLTTIPGRPARAAGQVVYIRGQVVDAACRPLAGAMVEIWQACVTGKYNHANDPNPAAVDPNFKYWGETVTDANGNYIFKTILPGAYPADTDWMRPPHVHFKVSKLGFKELVTQMYFKGHPLNEKDLILRGIPPGQRDSVIVNFATAPAGFEPRSLLGDFRITVQSVR